MYPAVWRSELRDKAHTRSSVSAATWQALEHRLHTSSAGEGAHACDGLEATAGDMEGYSQAHQAPCKRRERSPARASHCDG